jgi:hypothetical protein
MLHHGVIIWAFPQAALLYPPMHDIVGILGLRAVPGCCYAEGPTEPECRDL